MSIPDGETFSPFSFFQRALRPVDYMKGIVDFLEKEAVPLLAEKDQKTYEVYLHGLRTKLANPKNSYPKGFPRGYSPLPVTRSHLTRPMRTETLFGNMLYALAGTLMDPPESRLEKAHQILAELVIEPLMQPQGPEAEARQQQTLVGLGRAWAAYLSTDEKDALSVWGDYLTEGGNPAPGIGWGEGDPTAALTTLLYHTPLSGSHPLPDHVAAQIELDGRLGRQVRTTKPYRAAEYVWIGACKAYAAGQGIPPERYFEAWKRTILLWGVDKFANPKTLHNASREFIAIHQLAEKIVELGQDGGTPLFEWAKKFRAWEDVLMRCQNQVALWRGARAVRSAFATFYASEGLDATFTAGVPRPRGAETRAMFIASHDMVMGFAYLKTRDNRKFPGLGAEMGQVRAYAEYDTELVNQLRHVLGNA